MCVCRAPVPREPASGYGTGVSLGAGRIGNRKQRRAASPITYGPSQAGSAHGRPCPNRQPEVRGWGEGKGRQGSSHASNAYTFRQAENAEASQAPHHPNPHSSVTAALGAPKHARPGWQSPRVALRGAGSHTPWGPHACMEVHMRGQWWYRHRSQPARMHGGAHDKHAG